MKRTISTLLLVLLCLTPITTRYWIQETYGAECEDSCSDPVQLARMSPAILGASSATASTPTYFGSAAYADCGDGYCNFTDATTPMEITPPAGMAAGDLVVVIACMRGNATPTFAVSEAGGQTWTAETLGYSAVVGIRLFWCTFDGTWDASPSFSIDTAKGFGWAPYMHVFRPGSTPHTWAIDTAQSAESFSGLVDPYDVTVSGITTTNSNSLALFIFMASDDDVWSLQTGGISTAGLDNYINIGGADFAHATYYKVMSTAGATGDVTSRQTGPSSPDVGYKASIAFY